MKLNDFLRIKEFISKKFICPENEADIDIDMKMMKTSIDEDL